MRTVATFVLVLLVLLLGSCAAAPRSPFVDGRAWVDRFNRGDTQAVFDAMTEPLRATVGRRDALDALHAQLGPAAATVGERLEAGTYVADVRFASGATYTFQVVTDAANRVTAFLVTEKARHADRPTRARLRLPFAGTWKVVWGGRTLAQNYHVVAPDQRFAYDFAGAHRGLGLRNQDYEVYGRPVLAPADGTVVAVAADVPDNVPGAMPTERPLGNHVILDHGAGEYSFLAHLQPGSVSVRAGDHVTAGQALGRCGNSGHSSEPHLHYHLQDSPRPFDGEGMPAAFQDYVVDGTRVARGEPTQGQHVHDATPAAGRPE